MKDKAEHAWNNGEITKPATCGADGVKTYTCTICSATKTESLEKLAHSFAEEWTTSDTHHWHAATCEHNEEVKDKAEHAWNNGEITKPATCGADGVKTYTCTICSATKTESLEKLAHSFAEEWTTSNTHHWHAATCEHNEEIKDKAAHTWNDGEITTPATCGADGVKTYTCTVCGATKTESVEKLAHSFAEEWTTSDTHHWHAATCEHNEEVKDKAEHAWNNGEITKPATCGANGVKTYTCTICSATKTENIEKIAHSFADEWTTSDTHHWHAATCEHTTEVSGKAEHAWDNGEITKPATCGADGVKTYTCTVCNATKTEILEKIAHTYADEWTTSDTHHWHAATCEHTTEVSGKAEHAWDNGEITKPATCGADGVKTYTCTVCRATKTESVEKLAHSFANEWTTSNTHHWYAATCEHSEEIKDKAEHTWNDEGICVCGATNYSDGLSYAQKGYSYNGTGIYSVTGIGTCKDTDIVIPKKYKWGFVTSIGYRAFEDCSSLTSITIPDSVTSIGSQAFRGCSSLTSITIPNSVTSIGSGAFYGCSGITSINVEVGNPKYHSSGNCLIETASKTLVLGCKTSVIPTDGSVTSIGSSAFDYCSNLTSITIPDSVTSIGEGAFWGCDKLVEVINLSKLDITKGSEEHGYVGYNALNIKTSGTSDRVKTQDGYLFYTFDNVNYLLGYSGTEKNLVLPDNYNGQKYEIYNYAFYKCNSLTSITIPVGVTSIGNSVFYGCSRLTSITIPNSVTSIGGGAFDGCTSLKYNIEGDLKYLGNSSNPFLYLAETTATNIATATINEKCRLIGKLAFYECSSLTSITIPDSVTSIGSGAFWGCSSLTSITIGKNITSIGVWAFEGCGNIETAEMPTNAIAYIPKDKLKTVVINGGTNIEAKAFYKCSSLMSATTGNSVTSIGDSAFYYCSSLTSVTISNSVTIIGADAFSDCSSLTSVNYTGTIDQWAQIEFGSYGANPLRYAHNLHINNELVTEVNLTTATKINNFAFYYCSSLTSVIIPDGVTSIGNSAFPGCSSLTSVIIGNSVTSIGDSAFYDCSSLTSITIPNSVTSIGSGAFERCSGLTSVTMGNSVESIGDGAFFLCDSLTRVNYTGTIDQWAQIEFVSFSSNPLDYAHNLYINNELVTEVNLTTATKISAYAFYDCRSLTSVTIPDSVTRIGEEAFYGCNNIETATIPTNAIGYIPKDKLKTVIINGGTSIGDRAFYDCSSLTSITIPDSVTSIGDGAFYNCSSLTSITIPNRVKSIGDWAFSDCSSLTRVNYTGTIDQWAQIEFVSFSSNPLGCAHNLYINNELVTEVNLTTATKISDYAFKDCSNLTSISIPNSVTSIGDYAFYYCSSLTSISIPNSVTSIGRDAFDYCKSLTSVTIGNSVTSIGDGAFYCCSSLTSITIPNRVKSIGDRAFYYCSSLTSVTIGNSVTSIGDSAFDHCKSLTSVTIGNSVTSIGERAFDCCYKLVEVINLSKLDITKGSEEHGYVGSYALNVKTSGTSDIVNKGGYLFYTYNNINYLLGYSGTETELVLPNDYKGQSYKIYKDAFYYCSSLTSVIIPDGVTSIGNGAFHNCSSLTSVTIGNSVTSIGNHAFYNCSSLTSVTIGKNVTSIGNYAFDYCNKLVEVINLSKLDIAKGSSGHGYVGKHAKNVKTSGTSEIVNKDGYLFYTYDNVNYLLGYVGTETKLILPSNYNGQSYEINRYAFFHCSSLTNITIPNSVTSIGGGAFLDCPSLTNITFNGTMAQWKAISKGSYWNYNTPSTLTITCTDGKLDKNGNKID